MSRNVISSYDLHEGAAWTFVHSSGKRTEYAYAALMVPAIADPKDPKAGLDAMHKLLNPATDKFAMVSEKWLREGPVTSAASPTGFGSHWLVGADSQAVTA